MSGKQATLKLSSDSEMAAIHLAYSGPGRLRKDDPLSPVKLYLGSLAEGGERGQRVNLVRAARLITGDTGAGLADFDWRELSSSDVEHVRSRLRLEGYAPATINSTISALKGVALRAKRLGQMSPDELEQIRDVSGVRGDHRVRPGRSLSASEISALFRACDRASHTAAGARDTCLLALLYAGGLRLSEAVKVEISNWDSRRHALRVHGKGDRDRTITFRDGGARRAVNQWLRRRGRDEGPLLCPVTNRGEILVRPVGRTTINKALSRRAREAGVEHFSAHDLRRSIGTHLHEKTRDIELVREYLGHTDVRITQTYIRSQESTRRRAEEKIHVDFRPPSGKSKRRKGRRRGGNWRSQLRSRLK